MKTGKNIKSGTVSLAARANGSDIIRILSFVLLISVVVIPRWYYVEHFAVALPFWDQWDAEGDSLLRPWVEGNLRLSELWNNHNEHRILPTRILTLLTFELTRFWSNLAEARMNILLGASTPLLMIWLLYRMGELHGTRWWVVAVIIAGAVLPFSFENLLIGFQSQFYFLNLFALAALALVVFRPAVLWAQVLILILCMLSVLTMASGIFTPASVAGLYGLSAYVNRKLSVNTLVMMAGLLIISAFGYLTIPLIEAHDAIRAQNFTEMYKATIRVMGWPLTARKLYIGILWLPVIITLCIFFIRRSFNRFDLLMAGCFAWTAMQVVAIAYGRGHEMGIVPSRYTDLLNIGLAGNAWFVVRATEELRGRKWIRITTRIVAIVFFAGILFNHKKRIKPDLAAMQQNYKLSLIQTANITAYLKTGNKTFLIQPPSHIPYPNPDRLQKLLDDLTLRKLLPDELKR